MLVENNTLSRELVDTLRYKVIAKLNPNDKLPSERDLVSEYQVSRTTVRNALEELELRGIVYRQHGRGTFVSYQPQKITNLANTFSFTNTMKKMGLKSETKTLFLKERVAAEYPAQKHNLNEGDPIYELKRIRYANGEPMMVERVYLNKNIFEGLSIKQVKDVGLYEMFVQDFQVYPYKAEESCTATLIGAEYHKLLDVPTGTPGLKIERVTTDVKGRILGFSFDVARADKFVYHIEQYYEENNFN